MSKYLKDLRLEAMKAHLKWFANPRLRRPCRHPWTYFAPTLPLLKQSSQCLACRKSSSKEILSEILSVRFSFRFSFFSSKSSGSFVASVHSPRSLPSRDRSPAAPWLSDSVSHLSRSSYSYFTLFVASSVQAARREDFLEDFFEDSSN